MKPFGQGEKQQLQKGKKKSWLGHLRRYGATFMKGSIPFVDFASWRRLLGLLYIYSHSAIFERAQKLHLEIERDL